MKKLIFTLLLTLCCYGFICAQGTAQGSGSGTSQQSGDAKQNETVGVRILEKPRAKYTDLARENITEGTVRLRVSFLAGGQIGSVKPVSTLPDGLTEQAIVAARNLKFVPAKRNGVPLNVVKIVEYVFTLFFDEDSKLLQANAEILELPQPESPAGDSFGALRGKVKITVVLMSSGTAQALEVSSDLPKEFEEKARDAASKIKFKPAIYKNGKEVSQTKKIEYEFKPQKK